MNHDFNLACAHIVALTGSADTAVDFRILHDTDKGVPGINRRGRLADLWSELCGWNAAGYGVFIVVNATDGQGVKLPNITHIRAHFADLDNPAVSLQSMNELATWQPAPSFMVNTSPGKFHVYWVSQYPADQARFDIIQAKLIARFNGDTNSRDMARVLRLSGTFHMKVPQSPYLVTCSALAGYGLVTPPDALEFALSTVQVNTSSGGGRHELGDPTLAAPDYNLAVAALYAKDPNNLDRAQWISHMAAWKQAVSTLIPEHQSRDTFFKWCEQYEHNDIAENTKQWNSIRQTSNGWQTLKFGAPFVALGTPTAAPAVAHYSAPAAAIDPALTAVSQTVQAVAASPQTRPLINSEMLDPNEQQLYFKGCIYISRLGEVLDLYTNSFYGSGDFNATFGGKLFIWTSDAQGSKVTDEAWKAATRGTVFQIPKVHDIRFLPHEAPGAFIKDDLGRTAVNMYTPSVVSTRRGDPSPFLNHIALMIPNAADRKIYLDYLAHNIKFPGAKIPWAPVLISTEGIGKGIISDVIKHAIGRSKCYNASPQKMQESGNKFNAWNRGKVFIIADEIKVNEKRDMVEILKPLIADEEIEMEGKGVNQGMEDNYCNWQFHSNYKDAIPIGKNGRRYAVFFLAAQTAEDLLRIGMDDEYFRHFRAWVYQGGGKEIVADYFLNHYQIERGSLPGRAPVTSSMSEAIELSRSPLEQMVVDCSQANAYGFRGGWVSSLVFKEEARKIGVHIKSPATFVKVMGDLGYHQIGRAPRLYPNDPIGSVSPATLYSLDANASVLAYGRAQGVE